jgi:hypothetical protein
VYRARHSPYRYGGHGQLKHRIGDAVLERAPANGLRCDISTQATETFFGAAWLEFLAGGRATIGTESGSSAIDRRGDLQAAIADLLRADPGLTFEEVDARLPAGWDSYRFFAVSPRHLEAVVTQTAQILVEGRYSGVLEPERHYLPVRRDLSDLDEVLERARDGALLTRVADQALTDVYLSGRYGYDRLTRGLEEILDEHARPRPAVPGVVFSAARALSAAEGGLGRVFAAPAANVVWVGRAGARELVGGVRLAATDPSVRALLTSYLTDAGTREHLGPRQALENLLLIGAARRGRDARGPFSVGVAVDEGSRRILLRSDVDRTRPTRRPLTRTELEERLREAPYEFAWDHTRVASSVGVPLAAGRWLEIQLPAGPQPMPLLHWLARRRPARVARALASLDGD